MGAKEGPRWVGDEVTPDGCCSSFQKFVDAGDGPGAADAGIAEHGFIIS